MLARVTQRGHMAATARADDLIRAIVEKLQADLPAVLAGGNEGRRIVIHVAPHCASAKIEYPPSMVQVRPYAERT